MNFITAAVKKKGSYTSVVLFSKKEENHGKENGGLVL
jgi:hypothetical protein